MQIGAYTSRADAKPGWVDARGRYSVLSGLNHRVVEAEVDTAEVYRLQAIAPIARLAPRTCRALRNAGGDCHRR